MNRAVSFEYMNRQLVWNEFSVIVSLLLIDFTSSESQFTQSKGFESRRSRIS